MKEPTNDEFRWLEDIDGARSMEWVAEQNERTQRELADTPEFEAFYRQALDVLREDSRIPVVSIRKNHVYNLWQDAVHPRGLYRRMPLGDFVAGNTEWQTVLDVDALASAEGEPWVFGGVTCAGPESDRCLVRLSPGGSDAAEWREFNMDSLGFVPDGFRLSAGKHRVVWKDPDHLYVAPDLGGDSLTASGYPRRVVLWGRHQLLEEATTIYQGNRDSVSVSAERFETRGVGVDLVVEGKTFWTRSYLGIEAESHLVLLELPETATVEGAFEGRFVLLLHEDWEAAGEVYAAGSLLIAAPGDEPGAIAVTVLSRPDRRRVIADVTVHDWGIIVTLLDDVCASILSLTPDEAGGWHSQPISFPGNGSIHVDAVEKDSGDFLARFEGFTQPPTLYYVRHGETEPQVVRQLKPAFDTDRFSVSQRWVISNDGTEVPYFVVADENLECDGSNPVHMFAYGGFRNAVVPSYSGTYEDLSGLYGKLWLERGGVFVLANIRGGGEFGPAWHSAALKANRPRAFEDFESIAADLVARGVTTPERIGIEGRSNGGLLVSATMVRCPSLYGAVVCGVPLADMRRYHELLAGASWMGEYGNPDDPDEWAFIAGYAPYQNLDPDADYPPVLFYTSTRDDRVHPGHARKMMARMLVQGHEAWYHENIEGGHGGSVTPEDTAWRLALVYTFLWRTLAPLKHGIATVDEK